MKSVGGWEVVVCLCMERECDKAEESRRDCSISAARQSLATCVDLVMLVSSGCSPETAQEGVGLELKGLVVVLAVEASSGRPRPVCCRLACP